MITKIIREEEIQKAKKYVEKGESFVIVTHVSGAERFSPFLPLDAREQGDYHS